MVHFFKINIPSRKFFRSHYSIKLHELFHNSMITVFPVPLIPLYYFSSSPRNQAIFNHTISDSFCANTETTSDGASFHMHIGTVISAQFLRLGENLRRANTLTR